MCGLWPRVDAKRSVQTVRLNERLKLTIDHSSIIYRSQSFMSLMTRISLIRYGYRTPGVGEWDGGGGGWIQASGSKLSSVD